MAESIPPALQQILRRELALGERVAWQARPAPLSRVLASAVTFLFGIPFFAFSVFATLSVTGGFGSPRTPENNTANPFALLIGGMFMLGGASMLLSPLRAWWLARRTLYAVTDRRALLIEARLRSTIVRSFSGVRLADVVRREDASGRGDLIFERDAAQGRHAQAVYRDIGFFGIEDVRGVAQLLPTQPTVADSSGRRAFAAPDA
jgi:hypothetical protein